MDTRTCMIRLGHWFAETLLRPGTALKSDTFRELGREGVSVDWRLRMKEGDGERKMKMARDGI